MVHRQAYESAWASGGYMRKGFGICFECNEISYQEQTILSDQDRELGMNDGNCVNLICHNCWNEQSWVVWGENLYGLRIRDEELRMLDAELTEEAMLSEALEEAQEKVKMVWGKPRKPWALKPNQQYQDARGNQYVTDEHGALRRMNKPQSRKARRRAAKKAACLH
jgi:hypothetical protein